MAKKLAFDKVLFTAVLALTVFGLVMVYSSSAALARGSGHLVNPFLVKQIIAAVVGFGAMVTIMHLDYQLLRRRPLVYALVALMLLALVAVLFMAPVGNARRWFIIGGVSFQASELAKLVLVLYLAYQISRKQERVNQLNCLVPCAVMVALVAALVMLQPDMGTTLMLVAVPGLMLFVAGLSWRYVAAGAAAALPLFYLLAVSSPYRARRLTAFLDPESDPLGVSFQIQQSLVAVGSGGTLGRGLGESLQKLYFLPQPHSDFVYSIVCEELGILGGAGVLVLFGIVLWRGVRAGRRAPDRFGAYLAWGFTALLVLHALTHVSVSLALLPTTGITLPFVSYGGSSLVASLAACGVMLNVSQHG